MGNIVCHAARSRGCDKPRVRAYGNKVILTNLGAMSPSSARNWVVRDRKAEKNMTSGLSATLHTAFEEP